MKLNNILTGMALSGVMASCAFAAPSSIIQTDPSKFSLAGKAPAAVQSHNVYIVQLKGAPAIAVASANGELTPSNPAAGKFGNRYNPKSPEISAYVEKVKALQQKVVRDVGAINIIHSYSHTYNGFSARLTDSQVNALKNHPDVANVYQDELHQPDTANTPEFLGLTGPGGQHTLGIKGEDVIVGILDSGIWPENPSFSEDPQVSELAYGAPPEGWNGVCNEGSVGEYTENGVVVYNDETAPVDTFECNNKLIGARYYGETFSSVYEIQFPLGEFASPRDADGHGSHTASTAAGNEGVTATLQGVEVGAVSGIAPRARIAAYKVCWNSLYVSPTGVNERGCFFGDSMAAIDQAVVDGVDVLNYSIGNSNLINSPVYNAALRAADAGVFFSASAGNSGPTAGTTGNIAPWITTVAASTYDGESALVGTALEINSGTLAGQEIFSVSSDIGADIPEEGFSGELGLADPLLACEPLSTDLTDQIALIERGVCPFVDKFENAIAAGAKGVVVFTDDRSPIAMGGDATFDIPGVMIERANGLALVDSVESGETSVTMTTSPAATTATEVGNIMAGFSSRGPNPQSGDILKPDITAPGVRILAATSENQLDIPGNVDGESYAYLQGTSMSSPHIAGLAALFSGQYPDWSPAEIKSAIMTAARQNVVKEDGATPADPFDFGAGHADPVPAMNPGLVYSADTADYLAFLCGQGESGLVASLSDQSCSDLEDAGFSFDASQLNYPSIAIAQLEGSETIYRTVTDVTGADGMYAFNIDAPAGISVSATAIDTNGNPIGDGMLPVPANGTATYAITFTTTNSTVAEQWAFGSLTLEGNNGINVRSPIAVNPVQESTIDVPESLSLQLQRGRAPIFVQTFYTGEFSVDYQGLTPASAVSRTAISQPGAFDFNSNLATSIQFRIGEDTSLLRFVLTDDLVDVAGANIDLYLYRCVAFSCSPVTSSTGPGSNEDISVVNPIPNNPSDPGALYILFAQGVDTVGEPSVDYTSLYWFVDQKESTTRVTASPRAVENRYQNVYLMTRGLDPNQLYMGTMTFFDNTGESQGTTILEVQP
ncbi:S8 family serine peptidase [Alteromonas sp. H39]|uniref:S8 family serine peptidase n=1 Tax=Alteromonas sp. H39 TaxID=3389876 RepID=UPI0039E0BA24